MKRIFLLLVIAQILAFASAKAQTLDSSKTVNKKQNSLVGTWKPTFYSFKHSSNPKEVFKYNLEDSISFKTSLYREKGASLKEYYESKNIDTSEVNHHIDVEADYLRHASLILKNDLTFQIINSHFFYYLGIPGWEIPDDTLSGKWFLKGNTLSLNVSGNFSFIYQIVKSNKKQLILKEKDVSGTFGLAREIILKKE